MDSGRKCLSIIRNIIFQIELSDWRKLSSWRSRLKSISRACIFIQAKGGKNKEERLKEKTKTYLNICQKIGAKIKKTLIELFDKVDSNKIKIDYFIQLDDFYKMLKLHINLVYRRIINGEKIANEEKLYSIFERHTEWLQKGKQGNKVELGHKVLIATDQFHFIIHHKVIEKTADLDLTIETADILLDKFPKMIYSFSADKGFYKKDHIPLLELEIEKVVISKKGNKNKEEYNKEHGKEFKKCRNSHSAIESNINQLEHNGLGKCLDKGLGAFKRYSAIGVFSYNLNILGKILLNTEKNSRTLKKAA